MGVRPLALIGVVKQAVKTSAGTWGDWGKSSLAPQAANKMQSLSPSCWVDGKGAAV